MRCERPAERPGLNRRGRPLLLALALTLFATAGCRKGTYLEVRFLGDGLPEIWNIALGLSLTPAGGATKTVTQALTPPTAGQPFHFPTSMALKLNDDSGTLRIDGQAQDANGAVVATATQTTTVMHDQTWSVDLDFGGTGTDAGLDAAGPASDGGVIIGDDAGLVVTDGSLDDDAVGCAAVTLYATDSVTVDYDDSGPSTDFGNMLEAAIGANRTSVGWVKFNLRLIPRNARITGADLLLVLSQTTGLPPNPSIQYSTFDDWQRLTATPSTLLRSGGISPPIGTPAPGLNRFPLSTNQTDSQGHDWGPDLIDGVITLGVQNNGNAGQGSAADFFGVDHIQQPVGTRPSLSLVVCR